MTVKNKPDTALPETYGGLSDMGRLYEMSPNLMTRSRLAGHERDWRVYCAYAESVVLQKFRSNLREPWSICRLQRLADVLGPWRRHDVTNIDLPSLLKVDEWCECDAQLRERRKTISESEARNIKADVAWLEAQLADCPADTIFGVIAKLMVWRRKNARLLSADAKAGGRHALAFSAYVDLIRLTGLFALAIEADREFDDHFQFR
jgi:hypothetical protein